MAILIHVSVAIQKHDWILLVQEQKQENHGRWNLPGGHLELGETVQDGALCEVREEPGRQVRFSLPRKEEFMPVELCSSCRVPCGSQHGSIRIPQHVPETGRPEEDPSDHVLPLWLVRPIRAERGG